MPRYEKMKNHYYEMKAHALRIFPMYYHDKFQKLCRKKFFIGIFYIFEKSGNLLMDFEPRDMIFFQKIEINLQMSQKYFSSNKTLIILILLNKFSLWYKLF